MDADRGASYEMVDEVSKMPGGVGVGAFMWYAFCIIALLLVVRLALGLTDMNQAAGQQPQQQQQQRGSYRRKKKVGKRPRKKSPRQRRLSIELKSALAAALALLRLLYESYKAVVSRHAHRGTLRAKDRSGQRKLTRRSEERVEHVDGGKVVDMDEASDSSVESESSTALEGRGAAPGVSSLNNDVAVQASGDHHHHETVDGGWITVERPYRRQQSNVSDSTSCSSSGRNAVVFGRYNRGGGGGRPTGLSRQQRSTISGKRVAGNQPRNSKPNRSLQHRLQQQQQQQQEPSRAAGSPRIYRVEEPKDHLSPYMRYSSETTKLVDTRRSSSLKELLSSAASSSQDDMLPYDSLILGNSSSTAPSECNQVDESPTSPLECCQSAEARYCPEWVQKLIEDSDDDDDDDDDDDSQGPGLDRQDQHQEPSRPEAVELHSGVPEFSPALSLVYKTLQPSGIWVGLNHLARKIGYAAGGWEMIWNLADVGWIELSDCGLYCRLGDAWGSYEAFSDPASTSSSSSAPRECGDIESYAVYRGGSLDSEPDWQLCDGEETYELPRGRQPWQWGAPPQRGFANPPAMVIGLLK
ncbi:hypothetical protein FOZ61_011029 [Perkinsus olseni]|uniref:Uncharacterized protein n=1 Tax=Perkinsus olseni TaxID=32597 RepID=A0A7J6M1E5_PEROL|nr:hypothetical protein FOZ61_011029 [Perkinsus olseni]